MRQISRESWERTLRVGVTAPAFIAKAAAVDMERRKRGVIVNLSSINSERAAGVSPAYVAAKGLRRDAFEFQMLYGIRRDLQRQLVAEGYRLRLYVPFGKAWYPYYMRRMAERPANVFFVLRNLFR